MCPVRALSIFNTFTGKRLAWRCGSAGDTECWTGSRVRFSSHTGYTTLNTADSVGNVIMSHFSLRNLETHLTKSISQKANKCVQMFKKNTHNIILKGYCWGKVAERLRSASYLPRRALALSSAHTVTHTSRSRAPEIKAFTAVQSHRSREVIDRS